MMGYISLVPSRIEMTWGYSTAEGRHTGESGPEPSVFQAKAGLQQEEEP